ncbi:PREDICTED: olfactory receptor 52K2-like [Tauraco erythrolophus]|uniref:olfactory receptor 52K2-like n=1 Tax=Tauraco erythrolophus TaxID=121530 RepID=UPI000523D437|nr:PREDICTED: olfactory receptor 52K2-like [Tauraco erythrolophus]
MPYSCPTNTSLWELHLTGIPGLQHLHHWISIPFCIMYLITLSGNSILLYLIKVDPSLHLPMFLFLSMLAVIDLVMSTSITPKMLGIFWFRSTAISLDACLTQMYFVHAFSAMESGVLVAMAFDRYVAICNPAVVFMSPLTFQIRRLSLRIPAVVDHSYCEHMAVLNVACGNTAFSSTYSLSVSTCVVSFDWLLITLSYALILRAVLSLSSPRAHRKAFSTCGSHLCVMALFYIPGLLSMYMERYHQELPPHMRVLLADVYLLIPPAFNPLIYGIRTKQICDGARRLLEWGPQTTGARGVVPKPGVASFGQVVNGSVVAISP